MNNQMENWVNETKQLRIFNPETFNDFIEN